MELQSLIYSSTCSGRSLGGVFQTTFSEQGQTRYIIPPARSPSPMEPLSCWTCPEKPPKRGIQKASICLECINWLLSLQRSSSLWIRAPYPVSKAEPSHPRKDFSFWLICNLVLSYGWKWKQVIMTYLCLLGVHGKFLQLYNSKVTSRT